MRALTIRTDKKNNECDLIFHEGDERAVLDDFHATVIPSVDGASMLRGIDDSIVAIRPSDFDNVVAQLAEIYRERGYKVTIE